MNNSFAERYGYIKPSDALVVGCMPKEVINALCNCLYSLKEKTDNQYDIIRQLCWTDFFHEKRSTYDGYYDCLTKFLDDKNVEWFRKLSLIEFIIDILHKAYSEDIALQFVDDINYEFKRLNYGYRIIDYLVTPITENGEIECIEDAMNDVTDNVKEHLNKALHYLSDKEAPDYRNSVKESLSAVEAFCYNYTKKVTLTDSLKNLDKKGVLHNQLKDAFESLYYYSSAKNTGSRHGWAVEDNTFVPTYYEAKFMLVACSAFINYLRGKFL